MKKLQESVAVKIASEFGDLSLKNHVQIIHFNGNVFCYEGRPCNYSALLIAFIGHQLHNYHYLKTKCASNIDDVDKTLEYCIYCRLDTVNCLRWRMIAVLFANGLVLKWKESFPNCAYVSNDRIPKEIVI
ncbi:unnamed protein product [Vicia faba]|uniref:Uncharacterized protein n=1 Tax=Vicia faba TaxID=3906 RepID=A0AAV0ZTG5_VICFA|nr:unnamed protein product [Vicia faba]